ncbi:MAG: LysR family transcriptional regulator [Rhodomicrobium sp.]|jgi:DNA-binding transcriptional LysR family regulator
MTPTEELQLFEHVVATGSMSETARKLGVSAAEVSKYIGVLERRLGALLFYRPAARLELTASGKAYYASRILPKIRLVPASNKTCARGGAVVIPYRHTH